MRNFSVAIDARVLSMPATGTAFYIKSVVNPLIKAGYKITLVTNAPLMPSEAYIKKCKVVTLPSRSRFYWEQITLLAFLRKHDFDGYWAPWNYGLPYFYYGKTKFILSVLDMIPMRFPNRHLPRFRDKLQYKLSMRIATKKAHAVIAISEASANDFKKYYPKKDITPIHIKLNAIRTKYKKNDKDRYFLYIGGVDPRKNIGSLIRAFAQFRTKNRDKKLVLAGNGYEQFTPLIKELGVEKYIQLPGYISDNKKYALLQNCLALVYPSSIEGYGLPVAEAILADAPVITGGASALKEIAGQAAIYVNPNSPKAIRDAMIQITMPSILTKLKKAREAQKKVYLDSELDKKIVSVFRDTLDES